VTGGGCPAGLDRGWFVEPTVFADVDNPATIAQEEIFDPVLSVIAYNDVDDAIRIANDTDNGLGGSVWTTDPERGKEVAGGSARHQRDQQVHSRPGGAVRRVKASGIGRELGPEAIGAYQPFKSIYT
jgi:aldehyde dehydrogenase (NAD+)